MNQWTEAARHYASLDEQGRHQYWHNLTAEQQSALTTALNSLIVEPAVQPEQATAPDNRLINRPGVLATMTIGCAGFILGIVLTIGAQALAVVAGVQGVKKFVDSAVEANAADAEAHSINCAAPRDAYERNVCYIEAKRQDARQREILEGR